MHADPWLSLKDPPGTALHPARMELHRAVQLAACAGQSLLPKRPDDSQMALAWKAGVLLGEPLPGGSRVGLALADLALEVRDGRGGLAGRLPLNGRTPEEALKWVRVRLGSSGVDTRALKEEMPYEMPGRLLGREAPFYTESTAPLEALAAWYQAAAEVLAELVLGRSDAGPLRCWPHHFDLAALLSLDRVVVPEAMADGTTGAEVVEIVDGEGNTLEGALPEALPPEAAPESGRTIGAGLSPGDNSYDEPYFYVTPWPYPKGRDFPKLPAGHWHTEFWTGAVLTASELAGAEDPKGKVEGFLRAAVEACEGLLA
ncbi:MAG: hypothetical protein U0P81_11890 [Holophagaceae bacterium]